LLKPSLFKPFFSPIIFNIVNYLKEGSISYAMKRGRPVRSQIRQNMVDILFFLKEAYGYDIYRNYIRIFPKITLRSVYYHLRKGVQIQEFKIKKVKSEKGDYSWGREAEKIYYELGPNAKPGMSEKVKEALGKKK